MPVVPIIETLHFDNAQLLQQLLGNASRNLTALEERLGVKATSRDGWIRFEGDPESVPKALELFRILEASVRRGTPLRNRDFQHSLAVLATEGSEALQSMLDDRIQTSTRKGWITPRTSGQKSYLDAIRKHDITLGVGPAGTGKTYLAMAMATAALRENQTGRLILTRPAVEAGEALGFLPGDLQEKLTPYLRPLHDALHDMLPAEDVLRFMERGIIEIAPLAYMRGRTLNNAFIILDEAQNCTAEQMLMFLTRLGQGSRMVITGDPTQIDLPHQKRSGLLEAVEALASIRDIAVIRLGKRDVVRHPLVEKIVDAYSVHRDGPGPRSE